MEKKENQVYNSIIRAELKVDDLVAGPKASALGIQRPNPINKITAENLTLHWN